MALTSAKQVLVVGPGALGTALAGELLRRGFDVRCIGRRGPVALRAELATPTGEVRVSTAPPERDWLASTPLAIVAVKAFDLGAGLAVAAKVLSRGACVIPVANGAVDALVRAAQDEAPQLTFRQGFSTIGVTEVGSGRFAVRARTGEVSFGPLVAGGLPSKPEEALVAPPPYFAWHAGIETLVRRKWIYNVVINSLTAARSLKRNGDLMHDLPTLTSVFNEAHDLAVALWGPLPLDRQDLYKGLEQLIERTADNENSMARDKRLGRQTETDFLAGLATDAKRYPLLTELHAACT